MYINIDASEFSNLYEFHEIIKEKLNFPDNYNDTLEDLWDCLLNKCRMPLTIYWTDYPTSETLLGDNASEILDLFTEAQDEIDDFNFELQE